MGQEAHEKKTEKEKKDEEVISLPMARPPHLTVHLLAEWAARPVAMRPTATS